MRSKSRASCEQHRIEGVPHGVNHILVSDPRTLVDFASILFHHTDVYFTTLHLPRAQDEPTLQYENIQPRSSRFVRLVGAVMSSTRVVARR